MLRLFFRVFDIILHKKKMSVLGRLMLAIDYPQTVPADASEFVFKVDGGDVRAIDLEKRLVLTRVISRDEESLATLASYSAGRMLREDAALYWDERAGAAILAQEISSSATDQELKTFFETFADSCDWWMARTAAEPVRSASFPGMLFRP
jgi:hypothetical protein